MNSKPLIAIALGFALVGSIPASAQTADIRGPLLGHVFDLDALALRPVLGIPGAARPGNSVDLGFSIDRAIISPRGKALAIRSGDGAVVAVHFESNPIRIDEFPQLTPRPDGLVTSSHGSSVAIYYADAAKIDVLSGFNGAASLTRELDLGNFAGKLQAVTVSDEGDVLLAINIGETTSVYYVARLGEPRFVLDVGPGATVSLSNHEQDAAIADPQRNEVLVLRSIRDGGLRIDRWTARDGIESPVALAGDDDAPGHILVANSSGRIIDVNIDSATTSEIDCACGPTVIEPLDAGSAFRLTDLRSGVPMYVYDRGRQLPHVVLIPGPAH
jgi:hypothetical protein